jgi:molybdopterin converting factor small subunit
VTIDVELFANLASYLPPGTSGHRTHLDVPEASTVGDVARALGIPDTIPRIVLVNGHDAADDTVLTANDVLTLFPPLAGGAPPPVGLA